MVIREKLARARVVARNLPVYGAIHDLVLHEPSPANRVYIVSSLVWMAVVERSTPRITDYIGAAVCLAGAAVILYGPRWSAA